MRSTTDRRTPAHHDPGDDHAERLDDPGSRLGHTDPLDHHDRSHDPGPHDHADHPDPHDAPDHHGHPDPHNAPDHHGHPDQHDRSHDPGPPDHADHPDPHDAPDHHGHPDQLDQHERANHYGHLDQHDAQDDAGHSDPPDRAGHLGRTGRPTLADHADHQTLVDEVCRRAAQVAGDVRAVAAAEVRAVAPLLGRETQQWLTDAAVARLAGLGPLEPYLRDPSVDEVLVNRGREIWVDRSGILEAVGELGNARVEHLVERILAPIGRRLDRTSPIVDARLADGSRVCAVIEPLSVDGPTLSIRRFPRDVRPLGDFTDDAGAQRCKEIIDTGCNVVVSGPTSSGKTSLLASLVAMVSERERLLLLEDTSELPARHPHLVRLETRPATADLPAPIGLDDLVRAALRLRPDRLVIGEVRGVETLALVQAINTGHDGSLTTCHANSAADALLRLESLVLQAAPSWPLVAIREQLRRSIDVVIHVRRDATSGTRHIETITEVDRTPTSDGATPQLRTLYRPGADQAPLQRGRRNPR